MVRLGWEYLRLFGFLRIKQPLLLLEVLHLFQQVLIDVFPAVQVPRGGSNGIFDWLQSQTAMAERGLGIFSQALFKRTEPLQSCCVREEEGRAQIGNRKEHERKE